MIYPQIKRAFDFLVCSLALLIFSIPLLILILAVKATSKGSGIHWSKRIGINNDIFLMPKLRTMYSETPQLATDLMSKSSNNYITPVGKFLRKTSLDELPQLWSVIKGDMSIVGPRPALFNQYNLAQIRTEKGVHVLKPGITGWAQINGRDHLNDEEKTKFDEYYLKHRSFLLDLKIILLTAKQIIVSKDVSH
jgi:O-antigen biosynthesis protein WbqP